MLKGVHDMKPFQPQNFLATNQISCGVTTWLGTKSVAVKFQRNQYRHTSVTLAYHIKRLKKVSQHTLKYRRLRDGII